MTSKGKHHTMKKDDLIDLLIKKRIVEGLSRLSLFDYIVKELKYKPSYAYELIRDANDEVNNRCIIAFKDDVKSDLERWENLYEDAIKWGDKRSARECLKEIGRIKGHYVERVEHSGEVTYKIPEIIKLKIPDEGTPD
jgi:hypothetical protein